MKDKSPESQLANIIRNSAKKKQITLKEFLKIARRNNSSFDSPNASRKLNNISLNELSNLIGKEVLCDKKKHIIESIELTKDGIVLGICDQKTRKTHRKKPKQISITNI